MIQGVVYSVIIYVPVKLSDYILYNDLPTILHYGTIM